MHDSRRLPSLASLVFGALLATLAGAATAPTPLPPAKAESVGMSSERLAAMGQRARHRAERHPWSAAISRYTRAIGDVLRGG